MKQFKLTINKHEHDWHQQHITGAEIRQLGKVDNDTTLFYTVEGKDEEIHDSETVDLARIGIEHFYTVPNHPKFKFSINGEKFEWSNQYITGAELHELGKIPKNQAVFLKEEGKDLKIDAHMRVDLAPHGVEEFYSKEETHLVTITVKVGKESKEVHLKPGTYKVSEIKTKGNVPADYELDQLIDGKLHPLKDDASVEIKGCEVFVGHVKDGSSS